MIRKAAIVATVAALVIGAAALAAPALVLRYGEYKIDRTLTKIGFETTSMVRRGDVTVDPRSWTIGVRSIEISGAGRESKVTIGRLTITRPSDVDGRLTADRVVVDDLKVTAPGETISVPRAEIRNYAGPERGLTATPGLDRESTTQADLIARVSIDRVIAPIVIFVGEKTRIRRTVRNVVIDDVRNGVMKTLTADAVTIEAPHVETGAAPVASSILVSAKAVRWDDFSVPALMRVINGDGSAKREKLLTSASVSGVTASATTRPGGRVSASVGEIRVQDVDVKALDFPIAAFDPIATYMRFGEQATPKEIRDQLSFAVDLSKAVSFERIRILDVKAEVDRANETRRAASLSSAEIGAYADARIATVRFQDARYESEDGLRFSLDAGDVSGFDATGLSAYAQKVARDEVLLTTAPTAEEIVRIAPRITSVQARGLDVSNTEGSLKTESARIDVDAPLDAIPQNVVFRLDGVDASPPADSAVHKWVDTMELGGLKGSVKFSLTFDPSAKSLSLDWLDYGVQNLGELRASGKLEAIDPVLAVATGAAFVDKFSAIRIAPIKLSFEDQGATDVLLRRAAAKDGHDAVETGQAPEQYRETVAHQAQETISRVFGPTAESSAKAAAQFIRDPRAVEVTISPRSLERPLLDLIRAFDLGPAGLAQVVELSVLYKR